MNTPMGMMGSMTVPQQQPPVKKGHGCFFYGCLTTIVAVLLSLVIMYYVATKAIRKVVETYATASPAPISMPVTDAAQYHQAREKLENFKKALNGTAPVKPIVLTEGDLNAIIQQAPEMSGFKGVVSLEEGLMGVRGNLPLEPFGYKGLFLAGSARLAFGVDNGKLDVRLQEIKVGELSLPDQIMSELRSKNLFETLADDEKMGSEWKKISAIKIEKGTMTVVPVGEGASAK